MKYQLWILFFLLGSIVYGTEYHVKQGDQNQVIFSSHAPMETFEGKTSGIDGYVYWEGDQITNKSAVYFEVDLNSIRTGIGLRDRHMRENYLETDQWPKAYFKGRITDAKNLDNDRKEVIVSGVFFVHGVEKPLNLKGIIEFRDDQMLIETSFNILLTDYDIKIPKIMFLKLDNEIRLRIHIFLKKFKGEES